MQKMQQMKMNEQFLTTKPGNYYQTREVAEMLGISMAKLQVMAQLMGIKKDSGNIYIYTDQDIHMLRMAINK